MKVETSASPSPRSSVLLLLQNQTLLRKRQISLPDPQCPPPWQATRTTSIKVAALSNPKLAMQQLLPNLLTRTGAVQWREQERMTELGFRVDGGVVETDMTDGWMDGRKAGSGNYS